MPDVPLPTLAGIHARKARRTVTIASLPALDAFAATVGLPLVRLAQDLPGPTGVVVLRPLVLSAAMARGGESGPVILDGSQARVALLSGAALPPVQGPRLGLDLAVVATALGARVQKERDAATDAILLASDPDGPTVARWSLIVAHWRAEVFTMVKAAMLADGVTGMVLPVFVPEASRTKALQRLHRVAGALAMPRVALALVDAWEER